MIRAHQKNHQLQQQQRLIKQQQKQQQQLSAKSECGCPTPPPPPPPQRFRDTTEAKTSHENSYSSESPSMGVQKKPKIITKSAQVGNVKVDKQIIDTKEYQGYLITFETKSKEPNRYRIESSMVNKTTGESFLIAKTHVKTPKFTTKIVLDN